MWKHMCYRQKGQAGTWDYEDLALFPAGGERRNQS